MFGLSSKIIDYNISPDGLLPNLLAFNMGVEIGQLLALSAILIAMGYWRRSDSFFRHAYTTNVVMMALGFILIGYQLTGYFIADVQSVTFRGPLPHYPDLSPPLARLVKAALDREFPINEAAA